MSAVQTVTVESGEGDMRLDRWFRNRFPQLTQGRLQKLLRTGQVRVDGKRVKADLRLNPGQRVRVPPLPTEAPPPPTPRLGDAEIRALRERVIHMDDAVLVIDKPAGLAVQGGTGQRHHLDLMLDALKMGAPERPRLVHRLDKETSGVLVLARSRAAAAALAHAFRAKTTVKLYWALVVGVPRPRRGTIDLALAKRPGPAGERVVPDRSGRRAQTHYAVVENAGQRAAWLALMPLTGRTHQLRVHCAELGTPILGDGKYGGAEAELAGDFGRGLHLLARGLTLPHPNGGMLEVTAELPPHMVQSFAALGFRAGDYVDPFAEDGDGPTQPLPR